MSSNLSTRRGISAAAAASTAAHNADAAAHGGVFGRTTRVALIGDSLTENCQSAADTLSSYWFHAMNQRMGLPFSLEWMNATTPTFAKSGYTSAQLLSEGYAMAVAESAAELVIEMSGTNDLAGSTPADIANRRVAMWDLFLASGKAVVALPILPRVNLNTEATEVNRLLSIAAFSRKRVLFVWELPSALYSADGTALEPTYSSGDGTHFNDHGCSVIADVLAKRLAVLGNRRARATGVSLQSNRYMLGNTGGLADGIAVAAVGTGSVTPSKVAMIEAGVGRFWQRFIFSLTSQQLYTGPGVAITPGQTYRASALVRIPSVTTVGQVGLCLRFWGGDQIRGQSTVNVNVYTASGTVIETDPLICPATADTAFVLMILYGAATADFSDVCLFLE